MKLFFNKSSLLFLAIIFLIQFGHAQDSDEFWRKRDDSQKITGEKFIRKTIPNKFELFQLDISALHKKLKKAPARNGNLTKSNTIISFPNEKGVLERFEVYEASIMEEELQEKYPSIRSYIGKSLESKNTLIRFSVDNKGFHSMVLNKSGQSVFIDPYGRGDNSYIVYSKQNLPETTPFVCEFDELETNAKEATPTVSAKNANANDGNLRTFRLAIATTGEYSQFHLLNKGISTDATDDEKKTAVLAAINTTMTRVNGIFEKEMGLTMVLVENNKDIIFLDPNEDGFTNNDSKKLIEESQSVIDETIGSLNYDIGHTFSTGGGGLAQLNSPCTGGGKARGITGSANPIGDSYDIDYVCHEMGHQYGAHHTFNGSAGSCEGNRNEGTAVEPGSGSTIMAYAGLCTPDNVESSGDGYFHLVSIREMWQNISIGSSTCGELSETGNSVPVIEELTNYTIPISTPFILDAVATDADNDDLTYTWEQLDTEIAEVPLVSTATGGPAFRSLPPSEESLRFFPSLSTVLSGKTSNIWEVLPSVSRNMRFGVNVRDNNLNGGQTASRETILTVDGNSGPFVITTQSEALSWDAGTSKTINWDVANTDQAPVNCSHVNILLSIDGGFTYTIPLAMNVPNSGSHDIVVPNNSTIAARVKVESVDNVFYAINKGIIKIQASEFIMNFDSYSKDICAPQDAVYTFTYNTFLDFNDETTFSQTGAPDGATVVFDPVSATNNDTMVTMTVSGISTSQVGKHSISVIGTATSATKTTAVSLNVYEENINAPVLIGPEDGITELLQPYTLSWESDENAKQFVVELAENNSFDAIVESQTLDNTNYSPALLNANVTYFWRVKIVNECGEGPYSSIYSFTTNNEVCSDTSAEDVPIDIPDANTNGAKSIINITENKSITDINITVNITHPYTEDVRITLKSPSGKTVLLSSAVGGDGDNYINTVFDEEATLSITNGFPPFTGSYNPQGDLTTFYGNSSQGEWELIVTDSEPNDIGRLEGWSLEICGTPIISDDDDNDGVLNVNDLCPNTILGLEVDVNGCALSQLDDDNDGVTNDIDLCPETPNGDPVNAAGCSFDQLDDDNDGVSNGEDNCPNTPAGRPVDAFGCEVFSIPEDNYTIETISETCPDRNNGTIIISTKASYTYTVNFNGADSSFTGTKTFENIAPGDYDLCFTIQGEDYEQCFKVTIDSGITVSGKVNTSGKKATVVIDQGTAPYQVFINNQQVMETSFSSFDLAVNHGDLVEVKTAVSCEGVLAKTIELFDQVIGYPNPTNGHFEIALPMVQSDVVIELYNLNSQLLSRKTYSISGGKVQLSLDAFPSGWYLARVGLKTPVSIKILKQ